MRDWWIEAGVLGFCAALLGVGSLAATQPDGAMFLFGLGLLCLAGSVVCAGVAHAVERRQREADRG